MQVIWIVLLLLASYLIGSIPNGYIITKKVKGEDIRTLGSKSTGATNTFRVLGPKYGVLVFILDMLKSFPVIGFAYIYTNLSGLDTLRVVNIFGYGVVIYGLYGLFAVIGHIFPVFLQFKGGKAVATSLGVALILSPIAGLVGFITFLIVAKITKYASLGSIIGSSMTVLTSILIYFFPFSEIFPVYITDIITLVVLIIIIILRHRPNIKRLKEGTESQIES